MHKSKAKKSKNIAGSSANLRKVADSSSKKKKNLMLAEAEKITEKLVRTLHKLLAHYEAEGKKSAASKIRNEITFVNATFEKVKKRVVG